MDMDEEESGQLGFTHWSTHVTYTFCDEVLTLVQDPSSHVLGSTVWDSAKCFLKYMEKNLPLFDVDAWRRKRKQSIVTVCELGAGLGLAGMAFAKRGFHVVLTDVAPVMPWLEQNIDANFVQAEREGRVHAREYGWGTPTTNLQRVFPDGPAVFDIIMCADVVYEAACMRPLVKSILALSNRKTVIYMACERRTPAVQEEFWRYLNEYFVWKEIPKDQLDEAFVKDTIHVYDCRRKHTKTPPDMVITDGSDAAPQDGLLHCDDSVEGKDETSHS